jgi:hypothetical protein
MTVTIGQDSAIGAKAWIPVSYLEGNRTADWAVIRLDRSFDDKHGTMRLVDSGLAVGDEVTISVQQGEGESVAGSVTAVDGLTLSLSADSHSGLSGSPVSALGASGTFVGIHVSGRPQEKTATAVIIGDQLVKLLDEAQGSG